MYLNLWFFSNLVRPLNYTIGINFKHFFLVFFITSRLQLWRIVLRGVFNLYKIFTPILWNCDFKFVWIFCRLLLVFIFWISLAKIRHVFTVLYRSSFISNNTTNVIKLVLSHRSYLWVLVHVSNVLNRIQGRVSIYLI